MNIYPFAFARKHLSAHFLFVIAACLLLLTSGFSVSEGISGHAPPSKQNIKRYLYVATPGIRNYLEHGGHGILVFDIDNNHKFVKRIKSAGLDKTGKPSNVKGVCVSLATGCIYISTLEALQCINLSTEKLLWEKTYEGGCDRMAMAPDGKTIYLPSLEKDHWNIVDARTGDVIKKLTTNPGAHNTIYGPDGKEVYLGGLRYNYLGVAETKTHTAARQIGPFSAGIRPFTINSQQNRCFVNVNELLGFETGDLVSGKKLQRVEVKGYSKGPVKRHSCPSHGIGLTPDEREIWLCDSYNQRLHIFDMADSITGQKHSITLKDQPGWITFSLDGKLAYPSTGEVIDTKTYAILTALKDEKGTDVQSEKMVEIHFRNKKPVACGDQFGIGRASRRVDKATARKL